MGSRVGWLHEFWSNRPFTTSCRRWCWSSLWRRLGMWPTIFKIERGWVLLVFVVSWRVMLPALGASMRATVLFTITAIYYLTTSFASFDSILWVYSVDFLGIRLFFGRLLWTPVSVTRVMTTFRALCNLYPSFVTRNAMIWRHHHYLQEHSTISWWHRGISIHSVLSVFPTVAPYLQNLKISSNALKLIKVSSQR